MENKNNIGIIFLYLIIFLAGSLSSLSVYYVLSLSGAEKPLGLAFSGGFAESYNAPGDWIKGDNIFVTENSIIINIKNASLSSYAPTGSMRPVLDSGANGIRVVPKSEEDIHVGDIISFKTGDSLIIHRVIEKGMDDEGVYFITKGDNNSFSDGKIRFKDIDYLTIAIIY